jgi:SAM-dependent methyltransferase
MTQDAAVATLWEYEAFAPYYDAYTAESNYETWTEHVLDLARGLGLPGNTLLDLACGTGKSFVPFLDRGFDVTACDLSGAMLAEAARKAPDAKLIQADIRDLSAVGCFDLVTCFDDALNYLLEEADLVLALETIARNLSPAGVALFDLNTLLAYRTTFARDSVTVRDGTVFAWRGESSTEAAPGCRADALIHIFTPRSGGCYDRIDVRHAQRHFPPERVLALIARANLECLGVHGVEDDARLQTEMDEMRHLKVLYAVGRSKGGDS